MRLSTVTSFVNCDAGIFFSVICDYRSLFNVICDSDVVYTPLLEVLRVDVPALTIEMSH